MKAAAVGLLGHSCRTEEEEEEVRVGERCGRDVTSGGPRLSTRGPPRLPPSTTTQVHNVSMVSEAQAASGRRLGL